MLIMSQFRLYLYTILKLTKDFMCEDNDMLGYNDA